MGAHPARRLESLRGLTAWEVQSELDSLGGWRLDEAELLGFSRQYQNQIKAELKL